jgi:hypothetical protein
LPSLHENFWQNYHGGFTECLIPTMVLHTAVLVMKEHTSVQMNCGNDLCSWNTLVLTCSSPLWSSWLDRTGGWHCYWSLQTNAAALLTSYILYSISLIYAPNPFFFPFSCLSSSLLFFCYVQLSNGFHWFEIFLLCNAGIHSINFYLSSPSPLSDKFYCVTSSLSFILFTFLFFLWLFFQFVL